MINKNPLLWSILAVLLFMVGYFFVLTVCAWIFVSVSASPLSALPIAPFNSSLKGDRNLGDPFIFTIKNMSGYKPAIYHLTVYNYKILENYTYHSDAWGQNFKQEPDPGKVYLAIWVKEYLSENSTINWAYDSETFNVWIYGNQTIEPEPLKFSDLPEYCFNSLSCSPDLLPPVIPYEFLNVTLGGPPVSSDPFGYRFGMYQGDLYPGLSNGRDGWILYQIPKGTDPKYLRVCGWFDYYGYGVWYLEPQEILQNSPEQVFLNDKFMISQQIERGLRISDRPSVRSKG